MKEIKTIQLKIYNSLDEKVDRLPSDTMFLSFKEALNVIDNLTEEKCYEASCNFIEISYNMIKLVVEYSLDNDKYKFDYDNDEFSINKLLKFDISYTNNKGKKHIIFIGSKCPRYLLNIIYHNNLENIKNLSVSVYIYNEDRSVYITMNDLLILINIFRITKEISAEHCSTDYDVKLLPNENS